MPTIAEKRRAFRALHGSGCFVLPNPCDVGGARYLQQLGFKALATTSAGLAFVARACRRRLSRARPMLDHMSCDRRGNRRAGQCRFRIRLCRRPGGCRRKRPPLRRDRRRRPLDRGPTGDPAKPLYDLPRRSSGIKAARAAIDAAGGDTILVARSECFLVGHPDPLKEAIRRLEAFAEAGADCLYAPGRGGASDIAAIVKAVAPKPVNVLVGGAIGLTRRRSRRARRAPGQRRRRACPRRPGAASCARRRRSPRRAASMAFGEAVAFAELNGFFGEDSGGGLTGDGAASGRRRSAPGRHRAASGRRP